MSWLFRTLGQMLNNTNKLINTIQNNEVISSGFQLSYYWRKHLWPRYILKERTENWKSHPSCNIVSWTPETYFLWKVFFQQKYFCQHKSDQNRFKWMLHPQFMSGEKFLEVQPNNLLRWGQTSVKYSLSEACLQFPKYWLLWEGQK